ncbi:MAG: hypothetical protein WCZ23_15010 [Rhodospirillaceae bacterium]
MTKFIKIAGAALIALLSTAGVPAQAQPNATDYIKPAMVEEMRKSLRSPVALLLLKAQNVRHKDLTQDRITALDKQWRGELKVAEQPLVAQLFGNPLSAYLTRLQADSDGLYTEIFVMDVVGLNVGQSAVTSDYWQGDEAKWQKTYLVGPDAVFIDDPEQDDETGTWRVQVNLAIADPDTGAAIGAATVEVNLTELARRNGEVL